MVKLLILSILSNLKFSFYRGLLSSSCSLRLRQEGPSGPRVILPDGRADRQATGLRELDGLMVINTGVIGIYQKCTGKLAIWLKINLI